MIWPVRLVVCLPTYEERENLEALVRALGDAFRRGGLDDARILVVDDASPDGTGEIADRLAEELDWVAVLHRERKKGLGPAYVAGFRRALADGAELVMEMDADFSHDPKDVPRLVGAARHADLVLGSRYVPGGHVENWGPGRRAVSAAGSWYARTVLGLGCRDLTGGFKCFRREVLARIDLDSVSALGYAFQIETTYRAVRAGFRVVEIPITFVDREVGASKMTKRIVAEAIWRVPKLRLDALRGRL
jgi:dolichol-phosphate mannosyltransferase